MVVIHTLQTDGHSIPSLRWLVYTLNALSVLPMNTHICTSAMYLWSVSKWGRVPCKLPDACMCVYTRVCGLLGSHTHVQLLFVLQISSKMRKIPLRDWGIVSHSAGDAHMHTAEPPNIKNSALKNGTAWKRKSEAPPSPSRSDTPTPQHPHTLQHQL